MPRRWWGERGTSAGCRESVNVRPAVGAAEEPKARLSLHRSIQYMKRLERETTCNLVPINQSSPSNVRGGPSSPVSRGGGENSEPWVLDRAAYHAGLLGSCQQSRHGAINVCGHSRADRWLGAGRLVRVIPRRSSMMAQRFRGQACLERRRGARARGRRFGRRERADGDLPAPYRHQAGYHSRC